MSPELLIVGHLASNEDRTVSGTKVSHGGSAYYCAVGAGMVDPALVGVVAPVGLDFDPSPLDRLGVDRRGVLVLAGATPRFVIHQHPDGSRRFSADWGVARDPKPWPLPADYLNARHVHLATAPPGQQLAWLDIARRLPSRPTVSVDLFEHFAMTFPQQSRQVRDAADLVFLNEEEHNLLGLPAGALAVIKLGASGARYVTPDAVTNLATATVDVVDTTGAGDLLAGVFLASHLKQVGPIEALARAVRAATASVTWFGVDGPHLHAARDRVRPDPVPLNREAPTLCAAK